MLATVHNQRHGDRRVQTNMLLCLDIRQQGWHYNNNILDTWHCFTGKWILSLLSWHLPPKLVFASIMLRKMDAGVQRIGSNVVPPFIIESSWDEWSTHCYKDNQLAPSMNIAVSITTSIIDGGVRAITSAPPHLHQSWTPHQECVEREEVISI